MGNQRNGIQMAHHSDSNDDMSQGVQNRYYVPYPPTHTWQWSSKQPIYAMRWSQNWLRILISNKTHEHRITATHSTCPRARKGCFEKPCLMSCVKWHHCIHQFVRPLAEGGLIMFKVNYCLVAMLIIRESAHCWSDCSHYYSSNCLDSIYD